LPVDNIVCTISEALISGTTPIFYTIYLLASGNVVDMIAVTTQYSGTVTFPFEFHTYYFGLLTADSHNIPNGFGLTIDGTSATPLTAPSSSFWYDGTLAPGNVVATFKAVSIAAFTASIDGSATYNVISVTGITLITFTTKAVSGTGISFEVDLLIVGGTTHYTLLND
jgi:hypothetical protein